MRIWGGGSETFDQGNILVFGTFRDFLVNFFAWFLGTTSQNQGHSGLKWGVFRLHGYMVFVFLLFFVFFVFVIFCVDFYFVFVVFIFASTGCFFGPEIAGKPGRSSIEPKWIWAAPKLKSTLQPPASPKSLL